MHCNWKHEFHGHVQNAFWNVFHLRFEDRSQDSEKARLLSIDIDSPISSSILKFEVLCRILHFSVIFVGFDWSLLYTSTDRMGSVPKLVQVGCPFAMDPLDAYSLVSAIWIRWQRECNCYCYYYYCFLLSCWPLWSASAKGNGDKSRVRASSFHGCRPRIPQLLSILSDYCCLDDSRDSMPTEALPHSCIQEGGM